MSKIRIFKHFHYCLDYILDIKYIKKWSGIHIDHTIMFTDSCKYLINEPSCVNKLFGVCYGLFGVHKESDRIGWRYNNNTDMFELYSYSYNKGKLNKRMLDWFPVNTQIKVELNVDFNRELNIRTVTFIVNDRAAEVKTYKTNFDFSWALGLGFYFGGKSRAPHNITLLID